MIKSYSIIINEVDEIELALEELRSQLSELKLLENTVGIVTVNKDFVVSGVYSAVAKAVSFPLVGMTSYSQIVNGKIGTFMFSIMVLTSNDCEFSCGMSEAVPDTGDVKEQVQKCYNDLCSKLNNDVKLVFLYPNFMYGHYPNQYIKAITEINNSIPIFGSQSNGEIIDAATSARTLHCESISGNQVAMLLISGKISPKFYLGSTTKESIMAPNIGVVTAAEGNCLLEINNIKAKQFLEEANLKPDSVNKKPIFFSTFIADEKNEKGEIVSSVIKSLVKPKDDAYLFACGVQVGSSLSAISFTAEIVMETAKNVMEQIKANHKEGTLFIYSCLGRRAALLNEPHKEFELMNKILGNNFNYTATCSGGEICPTSATETEIVNNEHNETLIACIF
ncbi:MAG: FIST C-terminal domain-containing protein [Fibromonadaceae bacterium]|jgi:hypothetical protein|nr:FIST C-terminal domain-containing protein [Fibromonadaceae bacterium]